MLSQQRVAKNSKYLPLPADMTVRLSSIAGSRTKYSPAAPTLPLANAGTAAKKPAYAAKKPAAAAAAAAAQKATVDKGSGAATKPADDTGGAGSGRWLVGMKPTRGSRVTMSLSFDPTFGEMAGAAANDWRQKLPAAKGTVRLQVLPGQHQTVQGTDGKGVDLAEMQQLHADVDALEARIAALERGESMPKTASKPAPKSFPPAKADFFPEAAAVDAETAKKKRAADLKQKQQKAPKQDKKKARGQGQGQGQRQSEDGASLSDFVEWGGVDAPRIAGFTWTAADLSLQAAEVSAAASSTSFSSTLKEWSAPTAASAASEAAPPSNEHVSFETQPRNGGGGAGKAPPQQKQKKATKAQPESAAAAPAAGISNGTANSNGNGDAAPKAADFLAELEDDGFVMVDAFVDIAFAEAPKFLTPGDCLGAPMAYGETQAVVVVETVYKAADTGLLTAPGAVKLCTEPLKTPVQVFNEAVMVAFVRFIKAQGGKVQQDHILKYLNVIGELFLWSWRACPLHNVGQQQCSSRSNSAR